MRLLKIEELEQVSPEFRDLARKALEAGEPVPFAVTSLRSAKPTADDIKWAMQVAKKWELINKSTTDPL